MNPQRFRVWFRKGERVRYISHLDVLRHWERCLRRAELPLGYSQGFTPHPKLAFAGPLPLAYLADAEVMDVTLDDRVAPAEFEARLVAQTSEDLRVVRVAEIPLGTPAPQAALLWADYRVDVADIDVGAAREAVAAFMARHDYAWTEQRHEKSRNYDIRAMVATMALAATEGGVAFTMRLTATPEMMARPEQVLAAMLPGVEPALITRTGLIFEESSPAHEAWRRRGRFEE
jgi:radical SAM-linked protein